MKKSLVIIFLSTYCLNYSQNIISSDKKIENLIQIWGLLKYKHPNVSKGNFDFDKEFIKQYDKIKTIKTQEELNAEFLNWIICLNSEKEKIKTNKKKKELFAKNEDYSWIISSNFSEKLIEILTLLKDNSNFGKYYSFVNKMSSTVNFNNDKELPNFDAKKESHRFLFLASFWNKMRYWNVNIYLTETKWNKVLQEVIPDFYHYDKTKYQLAKDKLFSRLNDSHANYNYSSLYKNPNRKFSLYGGRIINDTLIINKVFNQEFAKLEGIELGDLIYSINGKKINDYYNDKFSNSISTSNKNYLKAILEKSYLLSETKDSLKISLMKKNGQIKQQNIKLYKFSKKIYKPKSILDTLSTIKWIKIKENIGYINLHKINKLEVENAFKAFKNTKGIILDLRNYPQSLNTNDISSFLYPKKKVFIKILTAYSPSIGKYDTQSALKIIKNPFVAGKNNKEFYKGKVILLVDRNTASKAEFFAMSIQSSPNCTTIGEQTFGAIMNRNEILLKDKTKIDFTSVGAFYPDNTNAQRKGLKIDFKVQEKAKKYNVYKYIDEAIKLIEEK
ncbi:S41 family peptidase [Polaribacter sargassicola]|uniref:S41 family peptidase n=1 Tax=Polaribacter sargassicola TaxID=2836891 RepID=UPI001F00C543|nr:S41 family peptidase [Polaribacter sp. DS7-9]MCG1036724.1 hypothetical protein [Polaribacter sp. DS7-9]